MINPSTNSTALSSYEHLSGKSDSRRIFVFQNVQFLELIVALFVFIAIHSLRQKKHYGLPTWPVLGMLPSLVAGLRTDVYEWVSDVLIRQNGTFYFKGPWFSNLNCVITADPRNLEHKLRTKFSIYPKGNYFHDQVHDLLGDGIFSADNETWQRQRKTASIEFHSGKFRQWTTESLLKLVHSRLLPVLENSVHESVPIDLQDILLRMTFDNVCMLAFGVDPGCLCLGLPEIPFAKAFEDATEATMVRFVTPTCSWKIMRYLDLGSEKKLRRSIKAVDEFADEVIRTRKNELSIQDYDKKGRSDLLTVFMGLKDENGEPFSDKFLRDICVNFILAGRDTSSVALSWFFWLLEKNPRVEENILGEICKIVSEREEVKSSGEIENPLVFKPEEIKKMEYLQAALSEALRLYPSVPVDHKEVIQDDVFPDGTVLKKGTKVVYAIYAMGRMETIWGKDYREYKPERWLRDGRYVSQSAYKFTAFNGGPRLCLGKEFAYYQMGFAVASIIYHYRVKVVKNHPVMPKLALTMYMKHGFKVNIFKREECELQKHLKI
ncbi:p450 domain-containing protein [Cephalotus follicularis]|uniref:p450 domain-containing protein n=1 Tax=Cephalotus follicularis TaxID=3775 RepID=A0A1Q3B7C1_CEPFO|nr:p450 domain-containing protein [Cephalotus follicularis]